MDPSLWFASVIEEAAELCAVACPGQLPPPTDLTKVLHLARLTVNLFPEKPQLTTNHLENFLAGVRATAERPVEAHPELVGFLHACRSMAESLDATPPLPASASLTARIANAGMLARQLATPAMMARLAQATAVAEAVSNEHGLVDSVSDALTVLALGATRPELVTANELVVLTNFASAGDLLAETCAAFTSGSDSEVWCHLRNLLKIITDELLPVVRIRQYDAETPPNQDDRLTASVRAFFRQVDGVTVDSDPIDRLKRTLSSWQTEDLQAAANAPAVKNREALKKSALGLLRGTMPALFGAHLSLSDGLILEIAQLVRLCGMSDLLLATRQAERVLFEEAVIGSKVAPEQILRSLDQNFKLTSTRHDFSAWRDQTDRMINTLQSAGLPTDLAPVAARFALGYLVAGRGLQVLQLHGLPATETANYPLFMKLAERLRGEMQIADLPSPQSVEALCDAAIIFERNVRDRMATRYRGRPVFGDRKAVDGLLKRCHLPRLAANDPAAAVVAAEFASISALQLSLAPNELMDRVRLAKDLCFASFAPDTRQGLPKSVQLSVGKTFIVGGVRGDVVDVAGCSPMHRIWGDLLELADCGLATEKLQRKAAGLRHQGGDGAAFLGVSVDDGPVRYFGVRTIVAGSVTEGALKDRIVFSIGACLFSSPSASVRTAAGPVSVTDPDRPLDTEVIDLAIDPAISLSEAEVSWRLGTTAAALWKATPLAQNDPIRIHLPAGEYRNYLLDAVAAGRFSPALALRFNKGADLRAARNFDLFRRAIGDDIPIEVISPSSLVAEYIDAELGMGRVPELAGAQKVLRETRDPIWALLLDLNPEVRTWQGLSYLSYQYPVLQGGTAQKGENVLSVGIYNPIESQIPRNTEDLLKKSPMTAAHLAYVFPHERVLPETLVPSKDLLLYHQAATISSEWEAELMRLYSGFQPDVVS